MINLIRKASFSTHQKTQSLIRNCQKDSQFIQKYSANIVNHMIDLVNHDQWKQVDRILSNIQLNKINNWKLLHQLSQPITISLKYFHQFSPQEQFQILNCLRRIKYEPLKSDEQFYALLQRNIDFKKLIIYSASLLSVNPQFFQPHRTQLETYLLKNRNKLQIIAQGIMADFWGQKFLEQLQQETLEPRIMDYIRFSNTKMPTVFQKARQTKHSSTQIKIGQFLKDLEYNVRQFQSINNFQVDFVLGKTIIEYNGMHHYRINTQTPRETAVSQWKAKIIKKRGFSLVRIPFFQWENYMDEHKQKAYLVQKVEKQIIKQYSS